MKLKILTILAAALCFNILIGSPTSEDRALIAKIEGLTEIQNVEIQDFFKHDAKVQVVNSCQILGLIVFASTPEKNLSVQELEAYVQVKLKSLSDRNAVTFLKDFSKGQVNTNCRAAVAKINDSK